VLYNFVRDFDLISHNQLLDGQVLMLSVVIHMIIAGLGVYGLI
jgi:hypothetical protein